MITPDVWDEWLARATGHTVEEIHKELCDNLGYEYVPSSNSGFNENPKFFESVEEQLAQHNKLIHPEQELLKQLTEVVRNVLRMNYGGVHCTSIWIEYDMHSYMEKCCLTMDFYGQDFIIRVPFERSGATEQDMIERLVIGVIEAIDNKINNAQLQRGY